MPKEAAGGGETKVDDGAAAAAAAAAASDKAALGEGGKKADGDESGDGVKTKVDEGAVNDKGKKKDGDGDGAQAQEKQGAPEKYELKLPENGLIDADDLAAMEKHFRDADLSQADAEAILAQQLEAAQAQSDRYLATLKADKSYGGKNFPETQKLARDVIAKVRPEGHERRAAFMSMVNRGGAFNNIEVVSFLADLGRMMAEDSGAGTTGTRGKGGDKPTEDVLYDNPTSKQPAS